MLWTGSTTARSCATAQGEDAADVAVLAAGDWKSPAGGEQEVRSADFENPGQGFQPCSRGRCARIAGDWKSPAGGARSPLCGLDTSGAGVPTLLAKYRQPPIRPHPVLPSVAAVGHPSPTSGRGGGGEGARRAISPTFACYNWLPSHPKGQVSWVPSTTFQPLHRLGFGLVRQCCSSCQLAVPLHTCRV